MLNRRTVQLLFPRDLSVILIGLIVVRVLFLLTVPSEAMSLDMIRWGRVIDQILAEPLPNNPYNTTTYLNGPPFWMQILFGVGKVHQDTGLSVFLLLRVLIIAVECVVTGVLYHFLKTFFVEQHIRKLLLFWIVFNPAAILLTCQHTQFDLFVALWVLLFLWALLRFAERDDPLDWLYSCFFLGMGILTKTVPFVLIPLLTFRVTKLPGKVALLGLVLLFGPVALGMSVIYVLGPEPVTERVIQYASVPGYFGITGLIGFLGGGDTAFIRYQQFFFTLLLGSMVGVTAYLREGKNIGKEELLLLATLLLIGLPTLGPGYGPQYLQWFLPLLVALYVQSAGSLRRALEVFWVVATLTYLFEYALIENLGAFLPKLISLGEWQGWVSSLQTPAAQALIHLPLFLVYCAVLGLGCSQLHRSFRASVCS